MKDSTIIKIFVIGSVIFIAGLSWYCYLYFFVYFDQLLTPSQKVFIYIKPASVMFVGALICNIGLILEKK